MKRREKQTTVVRITKKAFERAMKLYKKGLKKNPKAMAHFDQASWLAFLVMQGLEKLRQDWEMWKREPNKEKAYAFLGRELV